MGGGFAIDLNSHSILFGYSLEETFGVKHFHGSLLTGGSTVSLPGGGWGREGRTRNFFDAVLLLFIQFTKCAFLRTRKIVCLSKNYYLT